MIARERPRPRVAARPEVHAESDPQRVVAALFERHAAKVARVAHRVLGRDAEVDDVVQDVFSAALKKLPQLRDVESLDAWLMGAAIRRAREILRWRRVRALWAAAPEHDRTQIADPHACPEARQRVARLYEVLDRLGPNERIAWVLRYIEGQDLPTVARLCGCSLATVKRRIAAAQKLTRKVMDDDGEPA